MNDLIRLKKYKNIIYDFDMTIAAIKIDWTGWHDQAEKLFKSYDENVVYPRSATVHLLQNEMVKKYGKGIGIGMSKMNEQYEYNFYKEIIPNKELIAFIKENKDKHHFIVSNQNRLLLTKALKELGIDECIERSITRDDVYYIKPDPEGLLKLIDPNQPLTDYIYVGDVLSDEQAAQAVGMDFEYVKMGI